MTAGKRFSAACKAPPFRQHSKSVQTWVESRMGAVAATKPPRFPSPLIEPDVRISRIRLSDRLHDEAHG